MTQRGTLKTLLEDALAVARQGLNADPTMVERRQLEDGILKLQELVILGIEQTNGASSPPKIQQIKTLAAQMATLRRQSVAPSKAVHEVGRVLETAAIIFDPWPGSNGREP